jgi:uncharacterized protein (DUF1697 family)
MSRQVAFLRGVNLGRRQVKSADLKAVFEAMGYRDVRTVIASGNVAFDDGSRPVRQADIEAALAAAFGFAVPVVLRTAAEIEAMVESDPFAAVPEEADATFHVLMFDRQLPRGLKLRVTPGSFDILGIGARDVFIAAYRKPNGRYTEGLEVLDSQLPGDAVSTMRNWNTILRIAAL